MSKNIVSWLNSKYNKGSKDLTTHTRIGNQDLKIKGGSYVIQDVDEKDFWKIYTKHIRDGNSEYLTERQLKEGGCLAIDIDFRFSKEITKRCHNEDHIMDLLDLYFEDTIYLCIYLNWSYDAYPIHVLYLS